MIVARSVSNCLLLLKSYHIVPTGLSAARMLVKKSISPGENDESDSFHQRARTHSRVGNVQQSQYKLKQQAVATPNYEGISSWPSSCGGLLPSLDARALKPWTQHGLSCPRFDITRLFWRKMYFHLPQRYENMTNRHKKFKTLSHVATCTFVGIPKKHICA